MFLLLVALHEARSEEVETPTAVPSPTGTPTPRVCEVCLDRGRVLVVRTGPCRPFRCGRVNPSTGRREVVSCPDCSWVAVCEHGNPVEALR